MLYDVDLDNQTHWKCKLCRLQYKLNLEDKSMYVCWKVRGSCRSLARLENATVIILKSHERL